jgi:ATP-dependent RNA helicase RhlE
MYKSIKRPISRRDGQASLSFKKRSFKSGSSGSRGNRKNSKRIDENLFVQKAVNKEREVYVPKHTFSDFAIAPLLKKNIAKKEYITPSPIQDQSIPVALLGGDIIGIAGTGTGKTAAFLIPVINRLVLRTNKREKALVLAPTRELATQIEDEFRSLVSGMKLYSVSCVGGAPISRQMRELERGVNIVIGTPGRVKDLINRGKINLEEFHTVVLDEADRMLDMGFIDDMRFILKLIPQARQTFFYSATFSQEIEKLTREFLANPTTISVKKRPTSDNVEQNIIRTKDRAHKIETLHDVLIKPDVLKVLIFCEMKRSVDQLVSELLHRGFKVQGLHGDMRNRERTHAIKGLEEGKLHIVIATDVAARGIDISDITHVINFDTPQDYDTYIHRIGRTGRGAKTGSALTFV